MNKKTKYHVLTMRAITHQIILCAMQDAQCRMRSAGCAVQDALCITEESLLGDND